jgi:uncharacterized protein (TIGR02265 family)
LSSEALLEQRLALARPEHTLRGFFFNSALELVRELQDTVVLNRCVEAAGGNRFMAFFSYPVTSLNRLLYTAAWALSETQGGFDGAMRAMGHHVVPDFLDSAAGGALLRLAGRDPKRLLTSLPAGYRTAILHGECSIRWTTPSSGTLVVRNSTIPMEYLEGAAQGIYELTKIANVKVVGRREGLTDSEIDVSW